jgi:UDP-N-acetylglucosamine:LPS N-acetylglucosamine transferase
LNDTTKPERILFLYLPTGGGHVSNAKAMGGVLEKKYGAQVKIYDPVSAGTLFGGALLEDGYRIASLKVPFVWKAMFKANEIKANMRFAQAFTGAMARLGLRTILDEWRPTIVVCVHHLLLAEVSRMLRKRPSMRGIVVATDPFVPPAMWAEGHEFPILCYSEEAVDTFKAYGVPAERLSAHSIIINDKFTQRVSEEAKLANKAALGLDPKKPFVLIAGGGDGIRGADKILEELGASSLDFQLGAVCGRDEPTRVKAAAVAERLEEKGRKALVYGFTDKMYELITSADVVVSKGGPAVLGEVLAAGKPNLIAFFIPGQEEPNMRWVEDKGVGKYCPTPLAAREEMERLLSDPGYRARIERNIEALGFKNGLDGIVKAILRLE